MATGNGPASGLLGWIARGVVGVCFVGGAVAALAGRLVLAGGAFLAGHTLLGTAAVIQGQRRRGVGFSLSGLGWLLLALGLAVGRNGNTGTGGLSEQPLVLLGGALAAVGTLLVAGPFGE